MSPSASPPAALSLSLLLSGALWTIASINGSSGRARRRVTRFICVTTVAVVVLVSINASFSRRCSAPQRAANLPALV